MIVEFFGLPNTGKSALKKRLDKKGFSVSKIEKASRLKKIFYFLKHFLTNPISTLVLFGLLNLNSADIKLSIKDRFKVFLVRNSYLSTVLAKYQILKNENEKIFTDEYSYQSLFMIFQRAATKEELNRAIRLLPKSEYLFLFKGIDKLRYEAYKKPHPRRPGSTLHPGEWLNKKYGVAWLKAMELNFPKIVNLIKKDYKLDKKSFKVLNLSYPKIYCRK